MGEGLCIRGATEADLSALSDMTREFNEYLNSLGDGVPLPTSAEDIAQVMGRVRSLAFGPRALCKIVIAELDREVVGYVTYFIGVFMDDPTPTLYVPDFYVRKECRRRGIGKALMLEARRIGAELGASRLFWTVWDKNEAAIRFYEKLGARPSDGAILMEWQIRPTTAS